MVVVKTEWTQTISKYYFHYQTIQGDLAETSERSQTAKPWSAKSRAWPRKVQAIRKGVKDRMVRCNLCFNQLFSEYLWIVYIYTSTLADYIDYIMFHP